MTAIDLSTLTRWFDTDYVGGELLVAPEGWVWASDESFVLDPDTDYTIEVDIRTEEGGSSEFWFYTVSTSDPNTGDWVEIAHDIDSGITDGETGTLSIDIGPGLGSAWTDALANGSLTLFEVGTTVTAIRISGGSAGPPPDPLLFTDFEDFTVQSPVDLDEFQSVFINPSSGGSLVRTAIVDSHGSRRMRVRMLADVVGGDTGLVTFTELDPATYTDVLFLQTLIWPEGVPFKTGGKLNGIGGSEGPSVHPPSGGGGPYGRRWSVRWMWRDGGRLILYVYWWNQLSVQPDGYGYAFWTPFYLTPGTPHIMGMGVNVDTGGLRAYFGVEGDDLAALDHVDFTLPGGFAPDGFDPYPVTHYMNSQFRGGATTSWAASVDTDLLWDNIGVYPSGAVAAVPDPVVPDEDEDEELAYELYVLVLEEDIETTPGMITVVAAGGVPGDVISFDCEEHALGTATLSSDGVLAPTSLEVPSSIGIGSHDLTVVSLDNAEITTITSDAFNVLAPPAPDPYVAGADADPVVVPEAETSTGVYRWVLQDLAPGGLGSWVLPFNPASAAPFPAGHVHNTDHTTNPDGAWTVTDIEGESVEWSFTGYYADRGFQDDLQSYVDLRRRFYLIDHYNRAWVVTFSEAQFVPRKRRLMDDHTFNDETGDYTVSAVIYGDDWKEPT